MYNKVIQNRNKHRVRKPPKIQAPSLHGLPPHWNIRTRMTREASRRRERCPMKISKKRVGILLMVLVTVAVVGGAALAGSEGRSVAWTDMAYEHCPACGSTQQFRRACYDGRQVITTDCTVHTGPGCKVKKLYLGKERQCMNVATHYYTHNGDHQASMMHTKNAAYGADYPCPYGAHTPVYSWG